jgi:hypothetical protein
MSRAATKIPAKLGWRSGANESRRDEDPGEAGMEERRQ